MRTIRLAVAGLGVVGSETVRLLKSRRESLCRRLDVLPTPAQLRHLQFVHGVEAEKLAGREEMLNDMLEDMEDDDEEAEEVRGAAAVPIATTSRIRTSLSCWAA